MYVSYPRLRVYVIALNESDDTTNTSNKYRSTQKSISTVNAYILDVNKKTFGA